VITKPELDGITIKKTFWWVFDLFIIICFMLFGMVVADTNEQQIWVGALCGLIVHRFLILILRSIRDYVYGGRN
jgi:hypothetical protein